MVNCIRKYVNYDSWLSVLQMTFVHCSFNLLLALLLSPMNEHSVNKHNYHLQHEGKSLHSPPLNPSFTMLRMKVRTVKLHDVLKGFTIQLLLLLLLLLLLSTQPTQ